MKIPSLNPNQLIVIAVGVAILYVALRGFGGAAKDLTKGAVSVAGGAITGITEGIGEQVGVPVTSATQCEKDIAAGDHWAASFSCPAGKFLGSLF